MTPKISGGITFNVDEIEAVVAAENGNDNSTVAKMREWNRQVESFARKVTALAKEAPKGPWWDEMQQNIVAQQLSAAAGAVRSARCDEVCPKCNGAACKWCNESGFMPKVRFAQLS